ncbi:hypothetical protein [Leptospira alexanderi]|uniref:Uncharacterized protein n=1 Tax=Leptospira alexanderi serovar Manhao 3 str. L 60 TaxID=1049759 RepID=V6I9K2_9LEPT|nr:hypothetical protein [Leptospira alexanderi]EQA64329.1 hypothetical protein LEP1GSC062_0570 [Leptospira alexanderi serovar Manhao 3 str. L 60]
MGYKALITLDLPNATDENRKKFYESLEKDKWTKIGDLTTAWKASFNDDVERESAINVLKSDLNKAKKNSDISKYRCAMQVGKDAVEISNG